jgi:hypothetical protein
MAKKTEKPKTWKKKIGEVGVDSGQLMIIDPCYVSDQWIKEGEVKAVQFWGKDEKKVHELLSKPPYNRHSLYAEHCPQAVVEVSSVEEADRIIADISEILVKHDLLVIYRKVTDSTYDTCCELTGTDDKGGQLKYLMGHDGLGVAFSSGFGDGCYDVIATYQDFGQLGVRI